MKDGHIARVVAAAGAADTAYLDEITMMLRDLLRQVIKVRQPRVLTVIDEPANATTLPYELIEDALQVTGIWLQLLNIAEENAAMRGRRQMETRSGPDQVMGSFSTPSPPLPPPTCRPRPCSARSTRWTYSPPSRRTRPRPSA